MIPLASPNIEDEDIARVIAVLQSGMLVQGKEVDALEKAIATLLNVPRVLAASNGTATLHLALSALGIGLGDEVIVPSLSYIATANVVELVGATPIFVDVEPYTFNIDDNQISQAITPQTKAIIPVHEFGLPCNIRPIMQLAQKKNIFVIEDAACALGALDDNQYVGGFGDFGSFSLHPRKAITSGEGGLLACRNENFVAKISSLRNHGATMIKGQQSFENVGFNYRFTEMQAAMVRGQLNRLHKIIKRRQEIAEIYFEKIKDPRITLPVVPEKKTHSWQTFHTLIDKAISRSKLIESMRKLGIETNYGAQCLPAQPFYQRKYSLDCETLFPAGMTAWKHGLALPIFEKLTNDQASTVAQTLNRVLQQL